MELDPVAWFFIGLFAVIILIIIIIFSVGVGGGKTEESVTSSAIEPIENLPQPNFTLRSTLASGDAKRNSGLAVTFDCPSRIGLVLSENLVTGFNYIVAEFFVLDSDFKMRILRSLNPIIPFFRNVRAKSVFVPVLGFSIMVIQTFETGDDTEALHVVKLENEQVTILRVVQNYDRGLLMDLWVDPNNDKGDVYMLTTIAVSRIKTENGSISQMTGLKTPLVAAVDGNFALNTGEILMISTELASPKVKIQSYRFTGTNKWKLFFEDDVEAVAADEVHEITIAVSRTGNFIIVSGNNLVGEHRVIILNSTSGSWALDCDEITSPGSTTGVSVRLSSLPDTNMWVVSNSNFESEITAVKQYLVFRTQFMDDNTCKILNSAPGPLTGDPAEFNTDMKINVTNTSQLSPTICFESDAERTIILFLGQSTGMQVYTMAL